ncbi:patatin-like phospholipase family protein [Ideonella sp. A 288]|uniref:patatin-like phospholipase family protein n=1 Tax=Ideonella sp. A 288 TaxID=1962181 RepID=UPI000B4A6956|nr:patatin-like phospholipase family protein [Ideonella sp. A 288]
MATSHVTRGAAAPLLPGAGPRAPRRRQARVGLALAGGGPLGATWEIGALCALGEALPGLDFTALDGYVGVSAGGFVAAALANGMRPRQLFDAFIDSGRAAAADRISPLLFVRPALAAGLGRLLSLPVLAGQAAADLLLRRRSVLSAVERLGRALPASVFDNRAFEARMHKVFEAPGRTDDFRRLGHRLVLVATDLDSGEAAPFGMPGWDHVPISRAVAASAALPGLFPPVTIGGRSYVDGALKKTLHASVLLDQGLDLLLCLNPLVPFDATHAQRHRVMADGAPRIHRIVEGGLPLVLSQTFRSLIHSRLELGLKGYERSHPGTDIELFEPDQRDPQMFLANIFSYSQRRALAEHAYQKTRADLRSRRSTLAARLATHGLALDDAVLDDPRRRLVSRRPPAPQRALARPMTRLEEVLDDLELALAQAA